MRCIAASLLIALSASSALACYEPSAPSCAGRYGEFYDQDEFDRCRRQMESYRSEVEDYLQCIRDEIEERNQQAETVRSDFNAAVNSFNRRARR